MPKIMKANAFDLGPPAGAMESRLHVHDPRPRFAILKDEFPLPSHRVERFEDKAVHRDIPTPPAL